MRVSKRKKKSIKSNVIKIKTLRPKSKPKRKITTGTKKKKEFTKEFPFWARLKISKKRTTLVIDEEKVLNKNTKKLEDGFVHREATHTYKKEFEEISPNPDKDDHRPMYLKRPRKHPKRMFEPHNKDLVMPEDIKERYSKNNK